jgi:hypothetical protein
MGNKDWIWNKGQTPSSSNIPPQMALTHHKGHPKNCFMENGALSTFLKNNLSKDTTTTRLTAFTVLFSHSSLALVFTMPGDV